MAALCVLGFFREKDLRNRAQALAQSEAQAHQRAAAAERAAQEQRDVALDTLKTLVFEIQDKLETRVGMHALRESLLETAVQGLQRVQNSLGAPDAGASRSTAYALTRLSNLFQATGRTDQALAPLQKAQAMLDQLAAQAGDDPRARQDLVMIEDELSRTYLAIGRSREAVQCADREMEIARQVKGDETLRRRCLVVACGTLGDMQYQMGQPARALESFRQGVEVLTPRSPATPPTSGTSRPSSAAWATPTWI